MYTLGPLYKTVHYKTVLDVKWFKGGLQKHCIQIKIYRLYKKKITSCGQKCIDHKKK